ncbi:MAG: hypothetical protein JF610_01965 [Acidobacteria bacterium]|nr:hypothetical protein [Acidobacteriota bacterium]
MLLFRSEEDVDRWCAARGVGRGSVVTLPQAWDLSQKWYGNRLAADFRRPTKAEAQAIFESAGLTGPFWKL